MKKLYGLCCILLLCYSGMAQESDSSEDLNQALLEQRYAYIGFGTGLNSPIGLLGLNAEFPVYDAFSVHAGIGLGGWGWRYNAGAKYYLDKKNRWAVSVLYAHSVGIDSLRLEEMDPDMLKDEVTAQDVDVEYLSTGTLNLSILFNARVGKLKKNRFVFEMGYAIPLNDAPYRVISDHEFSGMGRTFMRILRPGGLILAIRFNFGMR